jgi:hypothetical protein
LGESIEWVDRSSATGFLAVEVSARVMRVAFINASDLSILHVTVIPCPPQGGPVPVAAADK